MSREVKHIENFEHDDNLRGNFRKHIAKKRSRHDLNFEESDNFLANNPKHILDFEKDDNFRGKIL